MFTIDNIKIALHYRLQTESLDWPMCTFWIKYFPSIQVPFRENAVLSWPGKGRLIRQSKRPMA